MEELDAIHLCSSHYKGDIKAMIKDLPRLNKIVKSYDCKTLDMIEFISRVGVNNAKRIIKEAHDEERVCEPLIQSVHAHVNKIVKSKTTDEPQNIRVMVE